MSRHGVAGSGGSRVVGPAAVDLRAGDHPRSEQARALGCQTDVVAAVGDTAVEVVLPDGGSCLQLCCSGWSWVVGVDAVGGPPHHDFTDDGEVRMAARRRPHRLGFLLAGVTSNLVGEVGNQLEPLGQIFGPNGMIMNRLRNAGKPRKRTWVGRRERSEAPVEDGGHVSCRV
jgi:hypothetical protein